MYPSFFSKNNEKKKEFFLPKMMCWDGGFRGFGGLWTGVFDSYGAAIDIVHIDYDVNSFGLMVLCM